jgi:hypothetical protein
MVEVRAALHQAPASEGEPADDRRGQATEQPRQRQDHAAEVEQHPRLGLDGEGHAEHAAAAQHSAQQQVLHPARQRRRVSLDLGIRDDNQRQQTHML